jgi:hypothetical protein
MKRFVTLVCFLVTFSSYGQSVFGYWYGNANLKSANTSNNYLIELVLQPDKGSVKGILNYYFKNTYRSMAVKGTYDASTRQLILKDLSLPFHGSNDFFEMDCKMTLAAKLRVSQSGSVISGSFISTPDYQYSCGEIAFNLVMNSGISKVDSVLQAIREFKEQYQVWKPAPADTLVAVITKPAKKVLTETENEFVKRQNQVEKILEVDSDTLHLSFYDNGEIDGDIISVFFNQDIILNYQKLTHKAIRMNIVLDPQKTENEISIFAENLGLIPPNTALMIVRDGQNEYNVNMSSNLQMNAVVKIKKRKPAENAGLK